MVQGRLTSLALRLVPPDWRDAVWADLSEEADAGRHGTGWLNWQIARTAGHLRWNGLLDAMTTDGAMALRSLRRSPGFVLTATTLLALGIGGSTLAFGVLYGVLLRPLPYEEDGRLVVVEAWHVDDTGRRTRRNYSLADLADWERVPAFESVALVKNQSLTLSSSDGLVRLSAAAVTDRFFATMRGSLVAGRGIGPEDGAAFVAVVSSRLWRDRLGAASVDEALTISLDGHAYRVVGVAGCAYQSASERRK